MYFEESIFTTYCKSCVLLDTENVSARIFSIQFRVRLSRRGPSPSLKCISFFILFPQCFAPPSAGRSFDPSRKSLGPTTPTPKSRVPLSRRRRHPLSLLLPRPCRNPQRKQETRVQHLALLHPRRGPVFPPAAEITQVPSTFNARGSQPLSLDSRERAR